MRKNCDECVIKNKKMLWRDVASFEIEDERKITGMDMTKSNKGTATIMRLLFGQFLTLLQHWVQDIDKRPTAVQVKELMVWDSSSKEAVSRASSSRAWTMIV